MGSITIKPSFDTMEVTCSWLRAEGGAEGGWGLRGVCEVGGVAGDRATRA